MSIICINEYLEDFRGAASFLQQAAETDDGDVIDVCLELFAEAMLSIRHQHNMVAYPFVAELICLETDELEKMGVPPLLWLRGCIVWVQRMVNMVHSAICALGDDNVTP